MTRHRRALLRALVAFPLTMVVAFGVSSCQAVARVTVAERAAGDGTVSVSLTLDKDAAAQFANLGQQLRLDDLRGNGWAVVGPVVAPDGSETVTVSRGFRNAAGAQALLGQVSGPSGPLHGLSVDYHHSSFTTRSGVHGTIDLRSGADAFADARLAPQLGVPSLAKALASLQQAGGVDPSLRLELAARLPGRATLVSAALGQTVPVSANASELNTVNVALAGIAALCLLALVGVGLHRLGLGGGRRRDEWSIAATRPPRRR